MSRAHLPSHIAIVMDGNGRWATQRDLPRVSGHEAGAESVRKAIEYCGKLGVNVLTVFAFSRENWGRPEPEVNALMQLFLEALCNETEQLADHNIKLKFIGDISMFNNKLQAQIKVSQERTAANNGLTFVIAANYSGKWDIMQAMQQIVAKKIKSEDINEDLISSYLSTASLPDPDLFIRTSGEQRISNFLLWQAAYSEFYFSDVLWPDFNETELDKALAFYASRQRRFGLTQEQLEASC